MKYSSISRRRGSLIPLFAMTVVGLFGFVALAVDLGALTIVRTNCQNAADSGALAGCRQLNNKPAAVANDSALAVTTATSTIKNNKFLSTPLAAGNISETKVGLYSYDTSTQKFSASFPTTKPAGQSWTAMRVTINANQPTFFARVFGVTTMPASAQAIAVHRPRDIALVLDFSGSMQFGSQYNWEPGWGGSTGPSYGMLNPDAIYPRSGHYKRYTSYQITDASASAASSTSNSAGSRPNPFCIRDSFTMGSGEVCSTSNLTVETASGPPMILDYRFDPSNVDTPSTKVTTPNSANLYSAFNRWMKVPPVAENMLADSAYRPTVTGTSTVTIGTGSATIRTFDFTGYDAYDKTGTNGPTPAPDNFRDQSDYPIAYVGDKYARKGGARPVMGNTWSPTSTTDGWDTSATNGAAVSVQDLMAYSASYNASAATPSTPTVLANYGNSWSNYRSVAWETYGYDLDIAANVTTRSTSTARTTGLFKGFSMGPAYYGKTFFMWPPDPRYNSSANPSSPSTSTAEGEGVKDSSGRVMADWRRRFFLKGNGTTFDPQTDSSSSNPGNQSINEVLLNATAGPVLNTGNNYQINYAAVLKWLKTGPQVLPSNLRAGRVVYYTSIPDNVNNASSDIDQQFWKNYIDFVLGYSGNSSQNDSTYTLAGRENRSWPEGVSISIGSTSAYVSGSTTNPKPYMRYTDNPNRPRLHFWFGPYTMMTFIGTRISSSDREYAHAGTVHEAQCWQLKAAMNSALDDIRNNHPNDFCGMSYFAYPNYRTTRAPMGQDWTGLKNCLFYPNSLLSTIASGNTTTELSPYNSSLNYNQDGNIPNANGSTDPGTGFALAYNLFSSSTTMSPAGTARKGASKILILETDGVPNSQINWTYNTAGYNSYYTDGGNGSSGASGAMTQSYNIIDKIMLPAATSTTGNSGYSLASAPVKIHAIAFGDLFSISPLTTPGQDALDFLGTVQYKGGTQSTDTAISSTNIITGNYTTRIDTLKTLMQRIMQSGVQVTLIQ